MRGGARAPPGEPRSEGRALNHHVPIPEPGAGPAMGWEVVSEPWSEGIVPTTSMWVEDGEPRSAPWLSLGAKWSCFWLI